MELSSVISGVVFSSSLINSPSKPSVTPAAVPLTPDNDHCNHNQVHSIDKTARRKLITVSVICILFMIAEIIGGVASSSLAIATDAAHLLTDFTGFMISLFAIWVAQRKPTRRMPFGWYRAEVIGALCSVLSIWVVTGVLVYMATERIINNDYEIEGQIMLITSALGMVVNIIMGLTLHSPGHNHSHGGHSHGHGGHGHGHNHSTSPAAAAAVVEAGAKRSKSDTQIVGGGGNQAQIDEERGQSTDTVVEQGPPPKNINVRAALIHIIGDFIQSVGVFIASLVIYFKPEYKIVDPICTYLFSILVLFTTTNILKDTLQVLMEGMPKDVDFNDVLETLLSIDGVVRVHNLRIWALSLDKTALSAHLAIAPNADSAQILKLASQRVHTKFNFFEMTLQIEQFQPFMENCARCQTPT